MTVRPLLRLRQAFQFTKLQLRNVTDDTAIFVGSWKKGAALRQRSIGGSRMLLRADQDSGRFLYFYGEYEPEECSYFSKPCALRISALTWEQTSDFTPCYSRGWLQAEKSTRLNLWPQAGIF